MHEGGKGEGAVKVDRGQMIKLDDTPGGLGPTLQWETTPKGILHSVRISDLYTGVAGRKNENYEGK